MPQAVNSTETHRKDLKSAPPDGYVLCRKLSYGEKQRRMQLGGGQSVDTDAMNNGRPNRLDLTIKTFDIQFYEFSHCILEHNLTKDKEGNHPINFKSVADFEMLDDAVGQEIEEFLNELNNEGDLASFREGDASSDSDEASDKRTSSGGIKDTGTSGDISQATE